MYYRSSRSERSSVAHAWKRARRVAAVPALAVALAAPAVAHASPPDHQPPLNETYDVHLGDGEVPCGPITVTFTDGERYTTFSNGVTLVTGSLTAMVTSDLTGMSVSLNVSGPGKFSPDGTISGSGAWLLYDTEVLQYIVGRISVPAGPDGPDVSATTVRGRRIDLCPLLGL
jgi:hypothetical protein